MVPDHDTKYEENPSSHHEGMCEDRQCTDRHTDRWTDRQTNRPGPFVYSDSTIVKQGIINNKMHFLYQFSDNGGPE